MRPCSLQSLMHHFVNPAWRTPWDVVDYLVPWKGLLLSEPPCQNIDSSKTCAFKRARLSFQRLPRRCPYYCGALWWHGDEVNLDTALQDSVTFMKLVLAVACMNDMNMMLWFSIIIRKKTYLHFWFCFKEYSIQIHPGYWSLSNKRVESKRVCKKYHRNLM